MSRLIFENGAVDRIKKSLLEDELETAGILFAEAVKVKTSEWKLLVREYVRAPKDAYISRSKNHIELQPSFLAKVIKKARVAKQSLIFTHTHPWNGAVSASSIDREGESVLMPSVFGRIPERPHGRLVLGPQGYDGLLYDIDGKTTSLEVIDVGPSIKWLSEKSFINDTSLEDCYDRQIRAFGKEGHRKLVSLKVGIVGLGGTGSVIVQQLAHLGVENFLLVDPDLLEATNLNRVVGTTPDDVGIPKIKIAEDLIRNINPRASVRSIKDSVLKVDIAHKLTGVDVLFSCTDTQASRAMLNYLSYQYFIPCFDMGVRIEASKSNLKGVNGRAQMIGPGLACLLCSNLLQPETVRREFMTEDERRADPYIVGGNNPQPAVISLNSTVASLAINMFLGAITGAPFAARYQIYKAEVGTVKPILALSDPDCIVCSPRGALGRGDSWPLPGRIT